MAKKSLAKSFMQRGEDVYCDTRVVVKRWGHCTLHSKKKGFDLAPYFVTIAAPFREVLIST